MGDALEFRLLPASGRRNPRSGIAEVVESPVFANVVEVRKELIVLLLR
jgi:hypothetical protein